MVGRQSDLAGWGVLAATEPRDEDQVREGKGVPDQIEIGGKEDRNEIRTFSTMPTVPNIDPRR